MMVCGLVPTAKLAAGFIFLSSLLSLFFLLHSCHTLPQDSSNTDVTYSCTLSRSIFSFEDGKAVLLDQLKFTLRRPMIHRRDYNGLLGRTPTETADLKFPPPRSPHPIRAPAGNPVNSAPQTFEVTNPAGHAPPGQNKDDTSDSGNPNAANPHGKDDPSGKNDPPPPPPVETPDTTTETFTTTARSNTKTTAPPAATKTTAAADPPPTFSSVSTKNVGGGSPQAVISTPPPSSQTIQRGGGSGVTASPISSHPAAVLTFSSGASPSSTPVITMSALPDYTTSLPSYSYPSFSPQSISGPTAFPTVISSENLSRNIHHSSVAIILGVLIPLLVLAAIVLAFILFRRRILRTRREMDIEERNSFAPVLHNPFGGVQVTVQHQIGRNDMLNMFRVSGRTPQPSIINTWSEVDNSSSEGHDGPPLSEKENPGRNSDVPFDPEKVEGEQPDFRDSRYSESDTSWIWYRPPMAI